MAIRIDSLQEPAVKRCLGCEHTVVSDVFDCPACGYRPVRLDGTLAFAPDLADDERDFARAGFARLAAVEPGNYWFESRNRLVAWMLRRYFPAGRSFFEVGCGTGFVLAGIHAAFPELRVAGGEMSLEGIAHARRRLPGVPLFQIDARHLPFEAEFDVIGSFDVLEHIDDDESVIAEMFRAAKRGGGAIVTVPQHPSLWSPVDDISRHKRRYTRTEMVTKLTRAGWHVLRATSFVSLLAPLMFITRARTRRTAARRPPDSELEVPRALNVVLGHALGVERALIRAGVSFPVGGSLLIVAAKR